MDPFTIKHYVTDQCYCYEEEGNVCEEFHMPNSVWPIEETKPANKITNDFDSCLFASVRLASLCCNTTHEYNLFDDDKLIGIAIYTNYKQGHPEDGNHNWELSVIQLIEEYKRKGIGSKFLNCTMKDSCKGIVLVDAVDSEDFYIKNGAYEKNGFLFFKIT